VRYTPFAENSYYERKCYTVYYACGHVSLRQPLLQDYEKLLRLHHGTDFDTSRSINDPTRCQLCSQLSTKQEYKRWEKERKRGEGE
jgi:hypothetical protein